MKTNRSKLLYASRCVAAVGMVAHLAATMAYAKGKPQPPTPPPVQYEITWFNDPGAEVFQISSVNPQGTTMVGSMQTGGVTKAVTIDISTPAAPVVKDLNTQLALETVIPSGWQLTSANGITSSGRIAGRMTSNLGEYGLFVYDPMDSPAFQSINAGLAQVYYRDMNDQGDLLYARSEGGTAMSHHLYTYDQQFHQLPSILVTENATLNSAGPLAINNDRLIAGNFAGLSDQTAFLFDYDADPSGATSITTIPPSFRSVEINNGGTVVGQGFPNRNSGGGRKALTFTSQDGKRQLTSEASIATAINESGQIAGEISSQNRDPGETAFIYDPTDGFWSLDKLLQDDSTQDLAFWRSTTGNLFPPSIRGVSEPLSASGYPFIVGDTDIPGSMFPDGMKRRLGFVFTPTGSAMSSSLLAAGVPEPGSAVLLVLAVLPLLPARRRRELD